MNLREHFSRFFEADPDRLHFASHSHHPWPDVAFDAHMAYWQDSAQLADDKWDHVFGSVEPRAREAIARVIGLDGGATLTFAPNTHDFVVRLFSCFEPPVRILSTDSEFHSFSRQSRRWEEAGLAIVDRVAAEPFETFTERFSAHVESGAHDLVFLSSVFFDSGFVVPGIDEMVNATPNETTFFVVDGYHQFMARPTGFGPISHRAFFLAGGYKYAMAGEGVCFLHCPDGYGERPVDTGWYAGFGQLESGVTDTVPYNSDGSRFAGATYDPSGIYRLGAVLEWLEEIDLTPGLIHDWAQRLQNRFLDTEPGLGELLPPHGLERGNFLTFRSDSAAHQYQSLHDRGVVTDYRADRLRIGFGIYQTEEDVDRLSMIVRDLG